MAVTTAGVAIANLGVNTSAWFKGLNKASKAWTSFGATLQVAGFRMATTIGLAITTLAGAVFKFGKDFEKAFAGVRKTFMLTGETGEKALGLIRKGLLELSKVSPFAATELANVARVGAQLGVQPQHIMKFTETISKLGIAVKELDMETAARGLSRLIKVTGGSMDNIDRLASTLAMLGDNFGTTEEAILKFAGRTSGLAAVAGITAQDLLGIGAAVTQVREQVESGATAIAKEIGILVEAVATNSDKLELMGRITGQTGEQFKKAFQEDAAMAIVDVTEKLGAMGGMAIPMLKELGLGNERAKQTILALANAEGELAKGLQIARKEFEENQKLNHEYLEMMKTVDAMLMVLWNNIKAIGIRIFDEYRDSIEKVIGIVFALIETAEFLVDAWFAVDEETRNSILIWGAFLAVIGPVMIVIGAIISVLAALGSILVPLVLMVGGMIAVWNELGEEGVDLGDVIHIVTELFFGMFSGGQRLLQLWYKMISGLAQMAAGFYALHNPIKATLHYTGVMTDKFLATMTEKIKSSELGLAQALIDDKKIQRQFDGLRTKISKYVVDLKDEANRAAASGKDASFIEKLIARAEEVQKIDAELKTLLGTMGDVGNATGGSGGPGGGPSVSEGVKAMEDALKNFNKVAAIAGVVAADFIAKLRELDPERIGGISDLLKLSPGVIKDQGKKMIEDFGLVFDMLGGEIKGPLADKFGADLRDMYKKALAMGDTDLANELATLGNQMGVWLEGPLETVGDKAEKTAPKITHLADALKQGAAFAKLFGGTIGQIGGKLTALGGAFGQIGAMNKEAGGGMFSGLTGALGKVGEKGGKGLMSQLSGVMSAAGPWMQIGMTAVSVLTSVFKKEARWEYIARTSAETFGTAFSEELAKQIEASEKGGLSFGEALGANIGDIAAEVGVTAENIDAIWGSFFVGLDTGVASAEQLSTAFVEMKGHLQETGTEGNLQIGYMVQRMQEAGIASAELTEHMREQAGMLIDNLAPALEYIGGLTDLTSEEATAFSGVVIASWAAAVESTGSFIGAVAQLGDTFGEALHNIQASLGEEGAHLVGPIAAVYNVISNNQEAFNALQGIVSGLDQMAQMGILTESTLTSMGEAVRATFDRILEGTNDETAALRAAWPELVKLYDYYKQMGMDVPEWLQGMIDKGGELGMSLEVPKTAEESMERMVGLLELVAEKLGAAADEIERAGKAMGGTNPPGTPPSGGTGGQTGFVMDVTRPMSLTVGETGVEHVEVTPGSGGGGSGGGMPNVTIMLDGAVLGQILSERSKTGDLRISPSAIKEF